MNKQIQVIRDDDANVAKVKTPTNTSLSENTHFCFVFFDDYCCQKKLYGDEIMAYMFVLTIGILVFNCFGLSFP